MNAPRRCVLLLACCAISCSPPREDGPPVPAKTKPSAHGRGDLTALSGSPDARAIEGAIETDVPGELTMKVARSWIAQTSLATGHVLFMSRDEAVSVSLSDNGSAPLESGAISRWLGQPWLKLTTPQIGTFRSLPLGRGALEAEIAAGSGKRDGVPTEVVSVRLLRDTQKGPRHVLVNIFATDRATPEARAEAQAMVRSLGPR